MATFVITTGVHAKGGRLLYLYILLSTLYLYSYTTSLVFNVIALRDAGDGRPGL